MEEARYRVVISDAAVRQLKKLDRPVQKAIKSIIDTVLTIHPEYGKPLQYDLKGHRRLRYMDYRIIYRIEFEISDDTVLVVAIGHRKEIYE
jgi:addiction module RelE/StbE family toxin